MIENKIILIIFINDNTENVADSFINDNTDNVPLESISLERLGVLFSTT